MFIDYKKTDIFERILEKALKDPSLPKFEYNNGVFFIKKLNKGEWNKYKAEKKKEFFTKFNELSLEDFECVEPSSSHLHVEIAYDTPHYKIKYYFYKNGLDIWENFNYVYQK